MTATAPRVVQALTYASDEHDRPPVRVTGPLIVRHVGPLNYLQHLVGGVPVDPDTVQSYAGRSWMKNPTDNAGQSYFATCERDPGGHCLPADAVTVKYAGSSPADQKQKAKYVKALLGGDHEAKVKAITGALDGSTVTCDSSHKTLVRVRVDHPEYWSTHELKLDKKTGKVSHYLENIFVKEPADDQLPGTPPRKGIGLEVFGKQVDGAVASGLSDIHCHAAKENPDDAKHPHNGYYTWPRFGFDQKLDDPHSKTFPEIQVAKERFPQAKSVLDIMSSKEGQDWWRANGTDLTNAKFDAAAGSRSLSIWEAYKAERAKVKPTKNSNPQGCNQFTGPGCAISTALHTPAGLHAHLAPHMTLTQAFKDKVTAMNPQGVKHGVYKTPWITKDQLATLKKILPPGTKIKQGTFDPATNDLMKSKPAAKQSAPSPALAPVSTIPFSAEHTWETGKPAPGVLNGIPFASAPPKFWEKTKDVDLKEPKPLRPIDRVGVMIQEPDGRVWIVQPTNEYGRRTHTIPGGGVEHGLTSQQNALKEVWEETGLHVEITGHLGDFKDSNTSKNGRLYVGRRIGGAPWDAKIEVGPGSAHIISQKTGKPAAESETVKLVTKERAAELLHRTDDLAQLATVHTIDVKTKTSGQMMQKLVEGIQPAAQKWLSEQAQKGSSRPGNQELHAVQELRGFNKPPKIVSKKEMDDLVKAGEHIEMARAVSGHDGRTAKELADEFKGGDHYPGHGIFGSGTYADASRSSGYPGNVATNGQYGNEVIRMVLPKTAKIIKVSDLEKAVQDAPQGFKAYLNKGGKGSRECWMGVQAALAGYDAIHADSAKKGHAGYGNDFYVVLNRGALVVQKENAKGHKII